MGSGVMVYRYHYTCTLQSFSICSSKGVHSLHSSHSCRLQKCCSSHLDMDAPRMNCPLCLSSGRMLGMPIRTCPTIPLSDHPCLTRDRTEVLPRSIEDKTRIYFCDLPASHHLRTIDPVYREGFQIGRNSPNIPPQCAVEALLRQI